MIKTDAVKDGHIGAMLAKINEAGFTIKAMKMTKLSAEKAGQFYEVHKERPFYGELWDFMSSGHIVAYTRKIKRVADFRTLIGATDPAKATRTIRKMFASKSRRKAVHGSDSDENAMIEGSFSFLPWSNFKALGLSQAISNCLLACLIQNDLKQIADSIQLSVFHYL
ncbi:MAG: nucleoside-diphosphate kinase [Bacteroidetes bacterium]|nr:nucleoside-diphosphate kinase [Bacteroidota bacterium]